jgi:dihydroxyacetone kinase-like protein
LLATALLRAAPEVGGDEPAATVLARAVAAAQAGIEQRGKASVGDKTMLDAIAPASTALHAAAQEGADVCAALQAAARAATDGTAATRAMRAKVERAGWLADRSEGHEDAAAHLIALIFASAARQVCQSGELT